MEIEVGGTYQSRSFPHIKRRVLSIKDRIVVYSIIDSRRQDSYQFRTIAKAVLSEFKKCTLGGE